MDWSYAQKTDVRGVVMDWSWALKSRAVWSGTGHNFFYLWRP